jgi:hypothetical protein
MSTTLSPSHTHRRHTWPAFKELQQVKGGQHQCDMDASDGPSCLVWFYDGPEIHLCEISDPIELVDFTNTLLHTANMVLAPQSKDGRLTVRTSTSNRGTCYVRRAFFFYTTLHESVRNHNPATDTAWEDLTMVLRDDKGEVTTVPQEAVMTVLDWEPRYDYEMIAGAIDIDFSLQGGNTDAWYVAIVGVPHYPPKYYGSIPFVSDVNLEAVPGGRVTVDGRAVQLWHTTTAARPIPT